MSNLARMSFGDLLDAIGSKTPAPGGGAVAGATGALAAALARMVVAYSLGKKSLAAHQAALQHADDALVRVRAVLLELADEDAAAYAEVNALTKLPETDPRRARELPAAAERSVQVPMAALAACSNLLRLLEDAGPKTNPHLKSDWAIAAILADAGARAAEWNVRVNLPLLADAARRAAVSEECRRALAESAARAARVENACATGA
ncbi:MAG: cyclodeaminase/cyclohydrolase family protein [Phycisphaerales bacterium]